MTVQVHVLKEGTIERTEDGSIVDASSSVTLVQAHHRNISKALDSLGKTPEFRSRRPAPQIDEYNVFLFLCQLLKGLLEICRRGAGQTRPLKDRTQVAHLVDPFAYQQDTQDWHLTLTLARPPSGSLSVYRSRRYHVALPHLYSGIPCLAKTARLTA